MQSWNVNQGSKILWFSVRHTENGEWSCTAKKAIVHVFDGTSLWLLAENYC